MARFKWKCKRFWIDLIRAVLEAWKSPPPVGCLSAFSYWLAAVAALRSLLTQPLIPLLAALLSSLYSFCEARWSKVRSPAENVRPIQH